MKTIDKKDALKIFYYLMSVDGQVSASEKRKFGLICKELGVTQKEEKEEIISECQKYLDEGTKCKDYYEVVRTGIEECLKEKPFYLQTLNMFSKNVPDKLLIWNLITLAFCDGEYRAEERDLIKFVAQKIEFDESIFWEMYSSMKTAIALEKEKDWLKSANITGDTTQMMIKELAKRQRIIKKSMELLIAD